MNAFRDLVRGFGLDVWRMQNLGNQSGATTTVAYLARPATAITAEIVLFAIPRDRPKSRFLRLAELPADIETLTQY
jgi:hypothetical protein